MTTGVLATEIAGLKRVEGSAKRWDSGLRDLYALGHEVLILHLDRIAAGGRVLPAVVPGKGRVTSQLSAFWFGATRNLAPSHFVTDDTEQIRRRLAALGVAAKPWKSLEGRAQLVNRSRSLPVFCEVIGALFDAEWEEYRQTGAVGGRALPEGIRKGERLPRPLLWVCWDDSITGRPDGERIQMDAHALQHAIEPGYLIQFEAYSRALFRFADGVAWERAGLRLARARFEFGLFDGTLVLAGSPLTPDTASYREPRPGSPDVAREPLDAFLRAGDWQRASRPCGGAPAPELPIAVARAIADRYRDLFERLTGAELIE